MGTLVGLILGYLIGSLSFPAIAAKILRKDLRAEGEGHLGATSIYRATGSIPIFLVTGILDALKGSAAYVFWGTQGLIAAMIGHMFPIFFGFRGGNAVSVYYGGVLAADPILVLVVLLEPATAGIVRSKWRHALYMAYRAVPAVFRPNLLPAYALLLLRHAWFYYVRFRQGSS